MNGQLFLSKLTQKRRTGSATKKLVDGSRVAVIGGGPAGASFAYFLLETAERVGLRISVDVYEPRDFSLPGPQGCNYCAGVISESLVQDLATEGLNLGPSVVERAVGSYVWHTDAGNLRVRLSPHEHRIATVFRGGGPRGAKDFSGRSFDQHLLSLAQKKGAEVVRKRVAGLRRAENRIWIEAQAGQSQPYDFVAVASGVNASLQNVFRQVNANYTPPSVSRTAIREYRLGAETIRKQMGNSLHLFLLDIPRLKFGMIVPKGDYVTVCLLGEEVDEALVQKFLAAPEVRACFPPDWKPDQPVCQCMPRIPVRNAVRPYDDRVVFIGDVSASRLYKDGMGSAFRLAKVAARAAVLNGISASDFKRHYEPACKGTRADNRFGKVVFLTTRLIQRSAMLRRAVLRMATREQALGTEPRMSGVLWDTFTGSASYRDILLRGLQPAFLWQLLTAFFEANVYKRPVLPELSGVI